MRSKIRNLTLFIYRTYPDKISHRFFELFSSFFHKKISLEEVESRQKLFIPLPCDDFVFFPRAMPVPFCSFKNLYFRPRSFGIHEVERPQVYLEKRAGFFLRMENRFFLNSTKIPNTTLILFERGRDVHYLKHFFHLLEHIVGLWSYYGDQYFYSVGLIVLAADGYEQSFIPWEGPNQINRHLLQALFPHAQIRTWQEVLAQFPKSSICFERAIFSDRNLSRSTPECARINKMLGVARHSLSEKALEHLSNRIHVYAETSIVSSDKLRVTYLRRPSPRTLTSAVEQKLFSAIRELKHVCLNVIDFALISFQEQVNTIGNTDVLVGVHGNGLSHLLFLPVGARIIEIFPPDAHRLDYRLFADARGVEYVGIISNRGVISSEEAYRAGPFGIANQTIHDLDVSLIVDQLECRVNRDIL